MHDHLYVHRDLKSHNIMIRLDPRATDTMDPVAEGLTADAGTHCVQDTAHVQGVQRSSGVRMVAKIGDLGTAVRVASKDSRTLRDVCGTSGYTGMYLGCLCLYMYVCMHTCIYCYTDIYICIYM